MITRLVNIALGVTLLGTSLLWTGDGAMFWNALLTGLAVTGVAFAAISRPQLRFLNALLGMWLTFSTIALGLTVPGPLYATALLGAAICLVSFVDNGHHGLRARRYHYNSGW